MAEVPTPNKVNQKMPSRKRQTATGRTRTRKNPTVQPKNKTPYLSEKARRAKYNIEAPKSSGVLKSGMPTGKATKPKSVKSTPATTTPSRPAAPTLTTPPITQANPPATTAAPPTPNKSSSKVSKGKTSSMAKKTDLEKRNKTAPNTTKKYKK